MNQIADKADIIFVRGRRARCAGGRRWSCSVSGAEEQLLDRVQHADRIW